MSDFWCVRAGVVPYEAAHAAQRALAEARHAGDIPDVLLLLEHPPVYTRGRRSDPSELPMGEGWYRLQGIEICATDRGGRVTYHGPGQLVGYPIIALRAYGDGVHGYVRRLEQMMLASLAESGLDAQVFSGLTGVWTAGSPPVPFGQVGPQGSTVRAGSSGQPGTLSDADRRDPPVAGVGSIAQAHTDADRAIPLSSAAARKIGAIGVHVRRGVTSHGFAINVNNDLQPFEWIVPCGIEACRATSLSRELGAEQSVDEFAGRVSERYSSTFARRSVLLEPEELAERVPGAGAVLAERSSVVAGAR